MFKSNVFFYFEEKFHLFNEKTQGINAMFLHLKFSVVLNNIMLGCYAFIINIYMFIHFYLPKAQLMTCGTRNHIISYDETNTIPKLG